ncbi:hypothetical protein R75483_01681 [Paraburkholderia domus]|nr:hypothetical protein R75483_01681 [Paraburkholderia domus]
MVQGHDDTVSRDGQGGGYLLHLHGTNERGRSHAYRLLADMSATFHAMLDA